MNFICHQKTKNKRKIIMHYGDQLSDWIERDYQKQIERVLVLL